MLVRIESSALRVGWIDFNPRLNVVLGADDAANSIGKSSALLVVDFAFGGSELVTGVGDICAEAHVGHHYYIFTFSFGGFAHRFRRHTSSLDVVDKLNEDGSGQQLSLKGYCTWLKQSYALQGRVHSFRQLVGPYIRVWGRGNHALPSKPLLVTPRQKEEPAIMALLDLYGMYSDVSIIRKQRAELKKLSSSLRAVVSSGILTHGRNPSRRELKKALSESNSEVDAIKSELLWSLLEGQTLDGQELGRLTSKRINLESRVARIVLQLNRLSEAARSGYDNSFFLSELNRVFDGINEERIIALDSFHRNVGRMVDEIVDERRQVLQDELSEVRRELVDLNDEILISTRRVGLPEYGFVKAFELVKNRHDIVEQISRLDKSNELKKGVREKEDELAARLASALNYVASKQIFGVNKLLNVVYGGDFKPSVFAMDRLSHELTSPDDAGTGRAFVDLVCFDVVALVCSGLPILVHDTPVLKDISRGELEKLVRIYSRLRKQSFISFDALPQYASRTQAILDSSCVIKLDSENTLFSKKWNRRG